MDGSLFGSEVGRRRFLQLAGLGTAGAALAACSSGGSGSGTTGTVGTSGTAGTGTGTTSPASSFPIGAAAKASSKPVKVTMWHSMTENNLKTLDKLVSQFNAAQSDVKVSLVNQTSYGDTLTAYTAALGNTANLPDLVQIESIDSQTVIDSQSIVPAGDAVAADHFDVSSLLPSTLNFFTVEGKLWGMPWNESSQILYFDQNAFERAGLDPAKPPTTLDEYRTACETIVSKKVAKFGTSLKLTPSNFEDWIAQAGKLFVNNGNGRTARATQVEFGGSVGQPFFDFYSSMLSSKLAQSTAGNGSAAFDNLFAIGSGIAPMTIETSAALGTILVVLKDAYKKVKLGVGPLPAPAGPGGTPYGGAGLFMVKDSPPERQDGAWQFIKFLLGAGPMATWSLGSGYIPINSAAVDLTAIKAAWAKVPQYKVAYAQILATKATPATAGAMAGPFAQIETILGNALTSISTGTSASSALSLAVSQSNAALGSYNSRV
jgi:sn-glycerol 3-phosphate transport system substrate-binding protein